MAQKPHDSENVSTRTPRFVGAVGLTTVLIAAVLASRGFVRRETDSRAATTIIPAALETTLGATATNFAPDHDSRDPQGDTPSEPAPTRLIPVTQAAATREEAPTATPIGTQGTSPQPAPNAPQPPSAAKGEVLRIAVIGFENKAGGKSGAALAGKLTDMLAVALGKTSKFVMVERDRLKQVMDESTTVTEQYFLDPELTARVGKTAGATHYVLGTLAGVSAGASKTTLSTLGVTKCARSASVAIDVRLANTETGVIEHTDTVRKGWSSESQYTDASRCNDGESNAQIESLARQAAEEAASRLATAAYPIRVVEVEGDVIYLNRGKSQGMKGGTSCEVMRAGKSLVDPDTGQSLGSTTTRVGKVKVTEVEDKFSKAMATDGKGNIQKGDICK